MSQEYDLVIIGAGPGGYVAAIRAGQLGLKTLIIEKESNLGGTCLNEGCIPSKTLLYYSEQFYEDQTHRVKKGLKFNELDLDFPTLMQTKSGVVKGLNMGIGGLLKKNKVEHKVGLASFLDNKQIEISSGDNKEVISFKNAIIATGSSSRSIPGLDIDEDTIITSKGALELKEVPKKMIVIGAGVIGLELGSVYKRLGTEVTFIEAIDKIGGNLEPSVMQSLLKTMQKQGMKFHLKHKFSSCEKNQDGYLLKAQDESGKEIELDCDVILVSIGRAPYTDHLGLDKVNIEKNDRGYIKVDNGLKTTQDNIFAIGDVVDGPMLAHKASEEGVAIVEKIAGHNAKINYLTIPNVMYTLPEVASVGFTAAEAKAQGLDVNIGSFPYLANSRAHCVDAKDGLVTIIADKTSDVIVGMHIMSEHAGEMIALGSLAIEKKVTAKELGQLCFAHPTFSEAIKEAALAVHKSAIHM